MSTATYLLAARGGWPPATQGQPKHRADQSPGIAPVTSVSIASRLRYMFQYMSASEAASTTG